MIKTREIKMKEMLDKERYSERMRGTNDVSQFINLGLNLFINYLLPIPQCVLDSELKISSDQK